MMSCWLGQLWSNPVGASELSSGSLSNPFTDEWHQAKDQQGVMAPTVYICA